MNGTIFLLAADAVLEYDEKLILVKRRYPPCKDMWALPGGMVRMNESAEQAVLREVREETGVKCRIKRLVGVFSEPGRDPRGRSVSICYHCETEEKPKKRTEETKEVKLFPMDDIPEMAFDHNQIIEKFRRGD